LTFGVCQGAVVSVVVPTFNSARYLKLCLRSLRYQRYPFLEIFVVDRHSDDETCSIAEALGAVVLFCKGFQSAARNLGFTHSRGCYVLFVDSDQQLEPSVVEECVSLCVSRGLEAVKIPEVFVGLNFWGLCSAFWKNRFVEVWGHEGGLPRFYKRDVLSNDVVFKSELLYWEDLELFERLKGTGVKTGWCESKIFHYEVGSLGGIVKKYLSYGQSLSAFEDSNFAPYASTLHLTLRTLFKVLRKPGRSPRVFFGFCFLFTIKSMCAVFGFLIKLFSR